ncbi:unnamed protein product [Brassicogethes aeneus]|uniref:Uncharacterized protein n=1 Tax=Brassicogethes aeneus TaxID=1431903 RepID=A0A9P0FCD6_BRAAE|nr:unnamed protein product [Brassicogethes aeneus]
MRFGVPMIWTNPVIHFAPDCYACVNKLKNTTWAQLPLPHSDTIPIPIPTNNPGSLAESVVTSEPIEAAPESMLSPYELSNVTDPCHHVQYTQNTFDSLTRRLNLSQRKSIILAQDLKEKNLLATGYMQLEVANVISQDFLQPLKTTHLPIAMIYKG